MASACTRVLAQAGYKDVDIHTLPGSLEIPLAARDLLAEDSAGYIDAVSYTHLTLPTNREV